METDGIAIAKSYSVTPGHIARVREMAAKLCLKEKRKISDSLIVRMAIDDLYEKIEAQIKKIEVT